MVKIKKANDNFQNQGERVFGFAKIELDPATFKIFPAYKFNVKDL